MPERPATYRDIIAAEAKKARVPPELALAMVEQESGGRPDAVSGKGARGLFQLMPETAKSLGVDPDDPIQNIQGGLKYLRQQLDTHKGDVSLALASYNAGPGAVQQAGGVPDFPETQAYVQKILARLQPGGAAPAGPRAPTSAVLAAQLPSQVGAPPPPPNPQQYETAGTPPPGSGGRGPGGYSPARSEATARGIATGFDPRTPTGRRNLAGAAGSIAAGAAVGGPPGAVLGGLRGAVTTAAGAAAGGRLAESGEQLVGTAPPSGARVASAGGEQALYETVGGTLMWPIKAVSRRLAASRVARHAGETLKGQRTGVEAQLETALHAARQVSRKAKTAATEGTAGMRQSAADAIRGARAAKRTGVVAAETQAAEGVAPATKAYEGLLAQPPSASGAGRQAHAVIQGPARTARDQLGQQVEEAAATGPPVNIATLKAEAQRILDKEIRTPQTAFPRRAVGDAGADALAEAGISPEVAARMVEAGGPNAQALQEAIAGAQAEAEHEVLKHPALGVLTRILNAEDEVPFVAAHAFKRELDDAIGQAWDKSIKTRVTNITQHLRGGLRGALTGHRPYDEATAAYQVVAPLYTKGIAPKLKKLAVESPESVVRLIKGNEPTSAGMLRDLLLTQAAEGGGGPEGQAAWDSVRSAWTHTKIIRGGIDTISDRLGKLDPEFKQIFYGDATGQKVLANLTTLETAYKQAVERGEAAVAGATETGRAGVEAAQAGGRQAVEATRKGGATRVADAAETEASIRLARTQMRQPTGVEQRFAGSSIGKIAKRGDADLTGVLADVGRAALLTPGIWGNISLLRLLRGPKGAELVEWAAYSPKGTQMLVQALTTPAPGMATAELLRSTGIFDDAFIDRFAREAEGPIGQPPPAVTGAGAPSRVGTPPPPPSPPR
jgi:hypothetical protein